MNIDLNNNNGTTEFLNFSEGLTTSDGAIVSLDAAGTAEECTSPSNIPTNFQK